MPSQVPPAKGPMGKRPPPSEPRRRRRRDKNKALKMIRKYQRDGQVLSPYRSIARIVRTVVQDLGMDFRMTRGAVEAFRDGLESYLIGLLELANLCAIHSRRVTVSAKDLKLTRRLKTYT